MTSARPDGSWTWRAAGAREPKGVLDGSLLHAGAKVGEVLKADADFELEGIVIVSVTAPRPENRSEPQRIEILGPGRPDGPGVTTQLVGRGDRRFGERRRDRDDGPGRRERTDGAARRERGGPPRPGAGRGAGRPEGDGPRGEGGRGRPSRPDHATRERTGESRGRGENRPGESRGRSESRPAGGPREGRPAGERRPAGPTRTSSAADRSRGKRLSPGSAHRKAVMETLAPEQQPIAEQLLRGGIPAVRTALHLEREKAEAEGRPAPNADELIALAESLLPRLRAAEWRDRAEAVAAGIDDVSMRDLRSVVAGADVARDEESRALAATLREALDRRVTKLHTDWAADIAAQLDSGRGVRAVRLSSRPPDPSARLEPELAQRLVEAAGATLSPATSPDLWASMLEAVAESPIRRSVVPQGLPENAPPELKRAAHQMSGTIPALGKLLGVTIPPPPQPMAGARRRPERDKGGRRPAGDRTPSTPTTETPTAEAPTSEAPAAEPEIPTAEPETSTSEPEAPTAEATAPEALEAETPDPDASAS